MRNEEKVLGIIRKPRYGVGDRGTVELVFTVYMTAAYATNLGFQQPQADEILLGYGVSDVKNLEGKPIWLSVDGNLVRFKEVAKL